MEIFVNENPEALGIAAGSHAGRLIREAIRDKGNARIILATGTSQFETLKQLIREKEIDWGRVTLFHLDEYAGIPATHPASFRKYLKERVLEKLPPLKAVHLIRGDGNAAEECKRVGDLINRHPIDLALAGIGENGHLAFNDPPADFETAEPFIVVVLDEACRRQQLNEGWFDSLEAVPEKAISMSIKQIMRSGNIICSVPDLRKAEAVKNCLQQPVNPGCPAGILQNHANCFLYLDRASASLISA